MFAVIGKNKKELFSYAASNDVDLNLETRWVVLIWVEICTIDCEKLGELWGERERERDTDMDRKMRCLQWLE